MFRQCLRHMGCAASVLALLVLAACGTEDRDEAASQSSAAAAVTAETDMRSSWPSIVPGASPDAPLPQRQKNSADVVFSTSFDDGSNESIFVGETGFGARASIVDGAYVVEVADGEWQTITVGPMPHLRDGVIEADVVLNGSGLGGLVARSLTDADGNSWMYVCLIDETGWAGCVTSHGDTYQDLFWGEIDGYSPGTVQHLTMRVVDDRIDLSVNGQAIGSAQDASVQLGSWGVFAESVAGSTATVEFDNLSISRARPGADPADTLNDRDRYSAHATRSGRG